jgi:hypothetical protein
VFFSPGCRVARFYNFELTQNGEEKKTRNGYTAIYFLKLNNVSVFLAKYLLK